MEGGSETTPPFDPDRTDDLARKGDADAFRKLYARLAPPLHVWATLRIPPFQRGCLGPEDVVQEVWYRAFKTFASFDATRATFRSWLFGVAKNVLLEATRHLRRPDVLRRIHQGDSSLFAIDQIPDDVSRVSRRLARNESLARLTAWIRALDPADRQLIIHCGIEDMRHEAVGELMGISKDAVTKRWQRLRTRLDQQGFPQELVEAFTER